MVRVQGKQLESAEHEEQRQSENLLMANRDLLVHPLGNLCAVLKKASVLII